MTHVILEDCTSYKEIHMTQVISTRCFWFSILFCQFGLIPLVLNILKQPLSLSELSLNICFASYNQGCVECRPLQSQRSSPRLHSLLTPNASSVDSPNHLVIHWKDSQNPQKAVKNHGYHFITWFITRKGYRFK